MLAWAPSLSSSALRAWATSSVFDPMRTDGEPALRIQFASRNGWILAGAASGAGLG